MWISRPQPRPAARVRLFCFPYAGGGSSAYRQWWSAFPPHVEVCSIQPPGRENRIAEPRFAAFRPYVEDLADALLPWLDLPFAFFGHSLGALTSFEAGRILRNRGAAEPLALFVSACRAPQAPFRTKLMHNLPDDQFLEELGRLNGTPAEALRHPELMALLLPVVRADFAVYESYDWVPGIPLNCAIHAFGGLSDESVTRADLAGWKEHTTSESSVRMFPGDHFFLNAAYRALVNVVCAELERIA